MKLTTATETLAILRDVFIPRLLLVDKHQHELDEAINLGISALKTIEDGNFMVKPTHQLQPQIDIKTLYEQTTMYCELINQSEDENYKIEIYQRPDTPIKVFVYWSKEQHKITSINYTIKGE